MGKLHFEFNQFENWFVNFPQKILMVGGGQKRAGKRSYMYLKSPEYYSQLFFISRQKIRIQSRAVDMF